MSHDRYFLDNIVDRIFEFDGTGHLKQYEGGYTDYVAAKERLEEKKEEKSATKAEKEKKSGEKSWKRNQPAKLKFSLKNRKNLKPSRMILRLWKKSWQTWTKR